MGKKKDIFIEKRAEILSELRKYKYVIKKITSDSIDEADLFQDLYLFCNSVLITKYNKIIETIWSKDFRKYLSGKYQMHPVKIKKNDFVTKENDFFLVSGKLTKTEQEVFNFLTEKRPRHEICETMQITSTNLRVIISRIRKKATIDK